MIKNPCHFVDSTDIIKYLVNIKGNIKGEKQQFIKRCNMETNHGNITSRNVYIFCQKKCASKNV